MNPVRTAWTEMVYRGPSPEIGDLYCHRQAPGEIWSCWEPTEEERRLLAEGGRVVLMLGAEPIPPVSVEVLSAADSAPVGKHPYRAIPELEDPERG